MTFDPQAYQDRPALLDNIHEFSAPPARDEAFTIGERGPLGRNLSEARARRQGNWPFDWAPQPTRTDPLHEAREELYTRFFETYGYMFSNRRTKNLMLGLYRGDYDAYDFLTSGLDRRLRAAIGPSDFPLLFGDTIDRVLLAKWAAMDSSWREYVKTRSVMDFRTVERYKVTPGGGILPLVGEGGSYVSDKPGESSFTYKVYKRGSVRNIFWEALVNDDLDALSDTPNDFAWRARQTEAYVATSLFCATGGVNTSLYATNHSGTYSNSFTYELSAEALAYVIGQMGNYPGDDADGLPILNDPVYLVVATKEMQFKAEQILNSQTVMYVGATDRDNLPTAMLLPDQIRSRMKVLYNPMIRLFDTTYYQTRWFLFSDTANGYAVETAFLQGYEAPQLFMRASSQMALGGGLASPMEGGFDNDAVDYKIRMVQGGNHTNDVGGWRFTATSYSGGGVVP